MTQTNQEKQKEEADKLMTDIKRLKMDVKELHIIPLENQGGAVNGLSMCLSPAQMAKLCTIINHEPEYFPDRMLSETFAKLFHCLHRQGQKLMQFVRILQRCPNLTIFYKDNRADILTLLRQASWLHGEPILAFIYPQ